MIFDSFVWKKELKTELRRFRTFISSNNLPVAPPDSNYYFLRVEKFFFVTAYIVRKLNESNKLSDELVSATIPVIIHPRKNKNIVLDWLNKDNIERFFSLKKRVRGNLSYMNLCNNLIHSFIFDPVFDDKDWKIVEIQVTSDRNKEKALYKVLVEDYCNFLEEVIKDDIVKISFNRITREHKKSRNK